jgi:cytochrome c peroxidase
MKFRVLVVLFSVGLLGFATRRGPEPYPFPRLSFFPKMPVSASNPVTMEGVELGRYLFYDTILSLRYDMSCASCHKQEAAFSDAPHRFSKGNGGKLTRRNSMPLFNLAWYPTYFWDGRAASLEDQVFHPVSDSNEMNLQWTLAVERIRKSRFYRPLFARAFKGRAPDSILIANAIGQFLRTIISNRSKYDRVLDGDDYLTEAEFKGFVLVNDMTKGDCLHCHTSDGNALGTTGNFSNNGLDAVTQPGSYTDKGLGEATGRERDHGRFKIPSFRNLAFTAPYMHDGRFQTLEQVIDFYSEGVHASANIDSKMGSAPYGGVHLSPEEKAQVIAFLLTMSDSALTTDPRFGNPFLGQ